MHETCDGCGVRFGREDGFFLGSIYFNYGLTSLVVAIVYPVLLFCQAASPRVLLWSAFVFAILFPVWFFRYARSLWSGFDQYFDPREGEVGTNRESVSKQDRRN